MVSLNAPLEYSIYKHSVGHTVLRRYESTGVGLLRVGCGWMNNGPTA